MTLIRVVAKLITTLLNMYGKDTGIFMRLGIMCTVLRCPAWSMEGEWRTYWGISVYWQWSIHTITSIFLFVNKKNTAPKSIVNGPNGTPVGMSPLTRWPGAEDVYIRLERVPVTTILHKPSIVMNTLRINSHGAFGRVIMETKWVV